MPSKPHTIPYGIVVCPFSDLSRNSCIQNELSTRGTGSLTYDATSRGKDTPGDEWVYERLTAVRPIPYFRLKSVIFPGATFGQANNRAYFSPEALVSRGKMKKKKKKKNEKKKKERKENINISLLVDTGSRGFVPRYVEASPHAHKEKTSGTQSIDFVAQKSRLLGKTSRPQRAKISPIYRPKPLKSIPFVGPKGKKPHPLAPHFSLWKKVYHRPRPLLPGRLVNANVTSYICLK